MSQSTEKKLFAAVIGGGVAGAEAAYCLSKADIHVAVFDQHVLPYGKLEDGLPKWHYKLRDKEEKLIDHKLNHPLVYYIPKTSVGRDIDFSYVAHMGFNAIIIAVGAWKDRPLPIAGIDKFIGKGFYYQNDFIWRFNHCHEPEFTASLPVIPDGAVVLGGGLASLDVVKVIMIETVRRALAHKNIFTDIFSLERSIPTVLSSVGLTLEGLGLHGCTLVYRKRVCDMPLTPSNEAAHGDTRKAEQVREKILNNFREKYLFSVEECTVPVDKIVTGHELTGIVLRKTTMADGQWTEIAGSERELKTRMVIASIGSVPEPIEGIPYAGQMFALTDMETCRVKGFDHVFTIGNAVTGRGNILESAKHAQKITEYILANHLLGKENNDEKQFNKIIHQIRNLQARAGYDGNYHEWVDANRPKRIGTLQ